MSVQNVLKHDQTGIGDHHGRRLTAAENPAPKRILPDRRRRTGLGGNSRYREAQCQAQANDRQQARRDRENKYPGGRLAFCGGGRGDGIQHYRAGVRLEPWRVRPFGNNDPQLFVLAVGSEVLIQLLAQVADLDPDDIIFVRVEIRLPAQSVAADFVLFDACRGLGERPLADVDQDVAQLRGFCELGSRRNSQDQGPAVMILGQYQGGGMV